MEGNQDKVAFRKGACSTAWDKAAVPPPPLQRTGQEPMQVQTQVWMQMQT